MHLLANTQTSIGLVLTFVAVVIAVIYAFVNVRQSRPEVGSEIELAANRKPYLPDAELEGRKLDRTLSFGLVGLFVLGIGLPLYWLGEPGRHDGGAERIATEFRDRGADMWATTEDGGFNCAFCHGTEGGGGVTPYTITDAEGRFVKEVQWKGPAVNTVLLRYTRDEVRYILNFGRPYSPMPAWGAPGGGPLTEQQIQNLIDYMESFQITAEQAQAEVAGQLETMMEQQDATCVTALEDDARSGLSEEQVADFDVATVDTDACPQRYQSEGEALFNMGYDDGFAGGAYSCGRCHTPGWSFEEKGPDGSGAMAPSLYNVTTQFPGGSLGFNQQVDFICQGSRDGAAYGRFGQGSGQMPGFCITPETVLNPDNGEVGIEPVDAGLPEDGAMFTLEQVQAVVEYTRSLGR